MSSDKTPIRKARSRQANRKVFPVPFASIPTRKPVRPMLPPTPDLLRFIRTPGKTRMRRWKRNPKPLLPALPCLPLPSEALGFGHLILRHLRLNNRCA